MLETIPVLMKMFSATSSIALDARLFLQSSIACTPYFSRGSVQHAASATPACSSSVSSCSLPSCRESYLCFLTHAIADACPQECSGCFCDNLCRDEDMYGGSVHAEEGAELVVGVVVNSQRGVTSACRCNSGECEVRLIHSVSQQLTRINGLAAAQTENHICIFHNFILFQVFYSLEGCFTGEQDIINLYNTVLCCFIQIFLCCVDRNFITDNNSLCTIGRAYLVDFLVSIFTCGIAGENEQYCLP